MTCPSWASAGSTRWPSTTARTASRTGPRTTGPASRPTDPTRSSASTSTTIPSTRCPSPARQWWREQQARGRLRRSDRCQRAGAPGRAETGAACSPRRRDARVARLALADAPRRPHASSSSSGYVPLTDDERARVQETAALFRLGISPYYLSLIDREHPFCPVRMQAIPVARRGARPRRASCATRSARTRRRPGRGHRPQVPGPGAVPRARHAAPSTAATAPAAASPRAARRSSTRGAMRRGHRVRPRRTPRCATCSSRAATRSCSPTSGWRSCSRRSARSRTWR